MGKWFTPQEIYEAAAEDAEEQYRKAPEHALVRYTVPWEQAGQVVKDHFIAYAIQVNKRLHEAEQQQAAPKKRPPKYKRKK